jgi:hypothetical protein
MNASFPRCNLAAPDRPAVIIRMEGTTMDHDDGERPGWVRLPGHDDDSPYLRAAAWARADGVRRVRRASNWAAAALIAGVAAATGYFAHHPPAAAPAPSAVTSVPGGTTAGPHKPSLTAPVVTSGGSGVTVGTGPAGARTITYRDN